MTEEERMEASEKYPLMQAKAGTAEAQPRTGGERATHARTKSMFLISPKIVRQVVFKRRTDDF